MLPIDHSWLSRVPDGYLATLPIPCAVNETNDN